MASYHAPQEWKEWSEWLAAGLDGRSRWRLPALMVGLLFGQGRRVVASWIRAAGLSSDYQDYYYFLQSVGHCWEELGRRVLTLVLLPFFFTTLRMPAMLLLLLWFAVQLLSDLAVPDGGASVAFRAHIGGFLTGMLLVPFFKRRDVALFA